MLGIALFTLSASSLAAVAVLEARRRSPDSELHLGQAAFIASLATLAVVGSVWATQRLLWVEAGAVGLPSLGILAFASAGVLPAFIAFLVLPRPVGSTHAHSVVALGGSLLLAATLGALAVVSAQAVLELRDGLSRGAFVSLLCTAALLLLSSPALGLTTLTWGQVRSDHDERVLPPPAQLRSVAPIEATLDTRTPVG